MPNNKRNIWSEPANSYNKRRRAYYNIAKTRQAYHEFYFTKWVWGIDPSLNGTGFAAYNMYSNTVLLDRIGTARHLSLLDRILLIIEWLEIKYKLFPPSFIIMESAFIPFGKTPIMRALELNKLNQCLEVALYNMGGALYKNATPRPIKKFISGLSNASKIEVKQSVVKDHGVQINDEDMNDAFAMSKLALGLLSVILNFKLDKYDYNDNKSMLKFQQDLISYFDYKYEGEVVSIILSSDVNLCKLIPAMKIMNTKRTHSHMEIHGVI